MMFSFSIGPGPFTWVVVNEMNPYAARSCIVAASVLLNRLTSGLVALTFLSLQDAIGIADTFYLYGGLGAAVTVFYVAALTDSTGVSLEAASA